MQNISKLINETDHNKKEGEIAIAIQPGRRVDRILHTIRVRLSLLRFLGYETLKSIILPSAKVDLKNKRPNQVCVMTGGTKGIGFEIVKLLLQLEITVVLGARNITAMENGIEQIRKSGISSGQVRILHLDLKSLESVRRFANQVLSLPEARRIDMLLNNAGIYQTRYEITEDNLECHFQVNYLSHFQLVNLLLPRIKQTAKAKENGSSCYIINTSSVMLRASSLQLNNLTNKEFFVPEEAYCDSKLFQLLHTKSLHRQLINEGLTNIQIYAIHPGAIPTDIWHEAGLVQTMLRPLLNLVCKSKQDAANTILYPALNPDLSEVCGGNYFENNEVVNSNSHANDKQLQDRLWEISMKLTTKHKQQSEEI